MNRREMLFSCGAMGLGALVPSLAYSAVEEDQILVMNTMARQRMLSNRITKGYFMMAMDIPKGESIRNMAKTIMDRQFLTELGGFQTLKNNKNIHDLYLKAISIREPWMNLISGTANKSSATQVLSLSESTLFAIDQVVQAMVKNLGLESAKLMSNAGLMRMYPQRSAKFYLAQQLGGIKETKDVYQKMRSDYVIFERDIRRLNMSGTGPALDKVMSQWKDLHAAIDKENTTEVIAKSESILPATEELLDLFGAQKAAGEA